MATLNFLIICFLLNRGPPRGVAVLFKSHQSVTVVTLEVVEYVIILLQSH